MAPYGVPGGRIGPMTAYQWLTGITDIRLTPAGRARAETDDFRRRFSSAMPPPPGEPGPPEPPRLPARGDDRRYGALVHVAVTVAGIAALLHRWRRPGSRWVL